MSLLRKLGVFFGDSSVEQETPNRSLVQDDASDADLEYIVSNVQYNSIPHDDVPFTEEERTFFRVLVQKCREANIDPRTIQLTRMATNGFNVTTYYCYVGKINIHTALGSIPDRYAVMKKGAKRAYKIFDHQKDAEAFISTHDDYSIEMRKGTTGRHMQYLTNQYGIQSLDEPKLEECIEAIPYWIKYMKYCKRSNSL